MGKSDFLTIWLVAMLFSLSLGDYALATDSPLSRGQAVERVMSFFDLEAENQVFLDNCRQQPDTCLFAFSARSNFDDLRLDPMILYPDVYPAYRYYDAINSASLLDLASGYYMEEDSPFRPEQPITKVEALKLVMGAAGILDWKEKFELSFQEQSWLKVSLDSERWWYGRYLATALSEGFISQISQEEAESVVSEKELLKIMAGANKIVASRQNTSLADTSGNSAI